ncbi:MAG: phosphoenolpyruvate--protein phosphotransferase [Rhodospirillales bacterium]
MSKQEKTFSGLGVSPGIGIGVAHVRESGVIAVPEYCIPAKYLDEERVRLKDAVNRSRRQIGRLKAKAKTMPGAAGEELGYLLDAYYHMFKNSRLVRGAEQRITDERINAEMAVQAEVAEIAKSFSAMDDAYIAARLEDIREVANRLVRNLTKTPVKAFSQAPKGSIAIAEEITPADAAQLDPGRIEGIATLLGGPESHTAILARSLGLPAVMGASGMIQVIETGDRVVIDGDGGKVIVNPTPSTLAIFERRQAERLLEERRLARLRKQPAVTRDGTRIGLQANFELPIQMDMIAQSGSGGIGLLRSEFMYMNRDDAPGEEEQYRALKDIVERMDGKPVTVRTLDAGGDKAAAAVTGVYAESASSALGIRGIRLSLARTEIFEAQLAAITRAGAHGNVRILLPMVSSISEVRKAREIFSRVVKRLRRKRMPIADPLPPIGIMIEVPSAALSADALAQISDFFAIGSNDLTMYTLAIDRGDEQVAHLFDSLHPAVLRLIQFSAEAGLRARIPVSICGEMAGDPRYTALLLGLGFRELSMTATSIPRVKQRIRSMDLVAADYRARVIMDQSDAGRIATLLDDFNALA